MSSPPPTTLPPPTVPARAAAADVTLGRIRAFLLVLVALGLLGSGFELFMIDHVERWQQQVPLYVSGAALLAIAVHAVWRRRAWTVRALQFAMMLLMLAGAAGTALHFQSNAEFQREMEPDLPAGKLLWKTLSATTPPALAPLILGQFGLMGLAYCYRHPATRRLTPEHA